MKTFLIIIALELGTATATPRPDLDTCLTDINKGNYELPAGVSLFDKVVIWCTQI